MTDTRQVLDSFDPTTTDDPVFVNIWNETDNFAEDKNISYVIRAVFLKFWCISRMEMNRSEDNLAKNALTLDAAADAEYLDDELANALSGLSMDSEFQVDINDCLTLIKDLGATNKLLKTRAGQIMEDMIHATGYRLPRICQSRLLADTARMLQSATTDAYYDKQPTTLLPYDPNQEFQVQVVIQLKLCGGTPSKTEPLNFPLNSRALIINGAFGTLLQSVRNQNPLRLGVLPEEVEERGCWLFQSAEDLLGLDNEEWTEVSVETIDEMKEEEETVFVVHSRQLETASAITKKVNDLQQDTSKKWFERREGRSFTKKGDLISSPEYLPAPFAAAAVQRRLTEQEKAEKKAAKNRKNREKKKAQARERANADQDIEIGG